MGPRYNAAEAGLRNIRAIPGSYVALCGLFVVSTLVLPRLGWALDLRLFSETGGGGAWHLPVEVSPEIAEVTFEVDTTLHLVRGRVRRIEGRVWLADEADPTSIRAELRFPIAGFFTGNDNRDGKIRTVMHAASFPEVHLRVERSAGVCTPESITPAGVCRATLFGMLSMSGQGRQVSLPIAISRFGKGWRITGETILRWPDFGIDDPSTFLAKVEEEVKLSFTLTLKA